MARGYLTPATIPAALTRRWICIPDEPYIVAALNGALLELSFPYNWENYGAVDKETIAEVFREAVLEAHATKGACMSFMGQPTILWDKKTQNTNGGTFTNGAWQVRDLNTIEGNLFNGITLNSNRFTLPIGGWLVKASAPAYAVGRHQIRLIDYPTGAQFAVGSSEQNGASADAQTRSVLVWTAILSSAAEFQIVHRCLNTKATNGFGVANNLSDEKYTVVECYPIS